MEGSPERGALGREFDEKEVARALELFDTFEKYFHTKDGLVALVHKLGEIPEVKASPVAEDLLDKMEDDLYQAANKLRHFAAEKAGIPEDVMAEAIRLRNEELGDD